MERNAKARVMAYARPFTRRTEKGKHYGQLTPKYRPWCMNVPAVVSCSDFANLVASDRA
jgi:hypothetical protein